MGERPEMDPPLPLELVEQFEFIESDPDTARSSGMFRIRTVGQANDTVARIAQHRARLAADEAWATAERQRLNEQLQKLNEWVTDQQEQVRVSCELLQEWLSEWATERIAEVGDGRKSVPLLAGELRFKKAPDTYTIETGRFLEWAKRNRRPDLVRQADPQPDRNAVKKLMSLADPNTPPGDATGLVDPATGQVVDGVTVRIGEDEFTVVTPELDP